MKWHDWLVVAGMVGAFISSIFHHEWHVAVWVSIAAAWFSMAKSEQRRADYLAESMRLYRQVNRDLVEYFRRTN